MANKKKTDDETLKKVLDDIKLSWDYTSSAWHSRWKDNHDLYNGNRTKVGYQGITDTFVPMSFMTVETHTSAIFGMKPKIAYMPPSTKPDQKTDILNSLYDHFFERDQWSLKNIQIGRSAFKLGMGIAYYYWENDHPCKIVVPIRDFIIDPTSTNGEDARYMGRRYLITKEQLEEYEVVDLDNPVMSPPEIDPMTGEVIPGEVLEYPMKKKYTNLDKIEAQGSKGDNTDKQEKDMWYGSTMTDPADNQIEVIEYWTIDKVISIANRSVIIEDNDNYFLSKAKQNGDPYPKGLMPYAWARDYTDESLFYAKGEIDIIADEQELLNDQTNQRNDAIIYSLNQMYTLDPKYGDLINEIENIPGAVYPVEDGALVPIIKGQIPADSFNESLNLKNEIRETTATNEVISGGSSQAKSDPTATEINAQMAGAGQRINLKVTQFENEFFHREARIVFAMIKLYITDPMLVRILGKNGATTYELFNPEDYAEGEYEPRAQLDITVQNRKQEEAMRTKELLAAFLGDPEINQAELKKMVLMRSFDLDPDEVESLVRPMQGMTDGMMSGEVPTSSPEMMPPMAEEDMMLPPEGAGMMPEGMFV